MVLHQSKLGVRLVVILCALILSYRYNVNGLTTSSSSIVVYGVPQCRELVLLTSKLAAKAGIQTSFICAPDAEEGSRYLMYGNKNNEDENNNIHNENVAEPISKGDVIEKALQEANSLVLIAYDTPIESKTVKTLMGSTTTESLHKIILLSKMGVTQNANGGSGGFFGGGGDLKMLHTENDLRDVCNDQNLQLTIVRGGYILKGGGPGKTSECDYGLSKTYYDTLFDIMEASVTMSHDKFTLGVKCTSGDTIEGPNLMQKMGTKSSFDPQLYESNRINIGNAIVASILYDFDRDNNNKNFLDFSVSAEEGEVPPTQQEWEQTLNSL